MDSITLTELKSSVNSRFEGAHLHEEYNTTLSIPHKNHNEFEKYIQHIHEDIEIKREKEAQGYVIYTLTHSCHA